MNRGEIWTVADGGGYARKPRPVVVVQNAALNFLGSVIVCPVTSETADFPYFRLVVQPGNGTGLRRESRIMVDKISAVPKSKLGIHIGELTSFDLQRLDDILSFCVGVVR